MPLLIEVIPSHGLTSSEHFFGSVGNTSTHLLPFSVSIYMYVLTCSFLKIMVTS